VAERLSDFARRFIAEPARQKDLDVPVLIWESATLVAMGGQTVDLTRSGPPTPVRRGEPVVFPLRKGTSRTNAFVMGVTVGRTDNNDLVLNDPSISRFHAYFMRDSRRNTWKLVDAESKNGTWMGALRLEPNGSVEVQDQARLRFGDVEMTYLTPDSFFRHVERTLKTTA